MIVPLMSYSRRRETSTRASAKLLTDGRRLFHPFVNGNLDGTKGESIVADVEIVRGKSRNDMEVNVKHILPAMWFIALPHGDSVGRKRVLHGSGHPRDCRHEGSREDSFDVVDLCHVHGWHDEHVSLIAEALMQAGKYRRVMIAVGEHFGRQLALRDGAEDARGAVCRDLGVGHSSSQAVAFTPGTLPVPIPPVDDASANAAAAECRDSATDARPGLTRL